MINLKHGGLINLYLFKIRIKPLFMRLLKLIKITIVDMKGKKFGRKGVLSLFQVKIINEHFFSALGLNNFLSKS